MKKIYFIFVLALSAFFVPNYSHAQGVQCTEVTNQTSYDECCSGRNRGLNVSSCEEYEAKQTAGQGTLGSGSPQNTNPVDSAGNTRVIVPTPRSSASALSACSAIRFESLLDILIWAKCIIGSAVIPLMFTLAFLYFLWNMVLFIRSSDDVKKKEAYKKSVYVGIIALVVMTSVWGIVRIVTTTFGLGNTVPQLQTDCLTTDPKNPCKKN